MNSKRVEEDNEIIRNRASNNNQSNPKNNENQENRLINNEQI